MKNSNIPEIIRGYTDTAKPCGWCGVNCYAFHFVRGVDVGATCSAYCAESLRQDLAAAGQRKADAHEAGVRG